MYSNAPKHEIEAAVIGKAAAAAASVRDIITEISLRFRGTSGQFACEMRNPAGRLARQRAGFAFASDTDVIAGQSFSDRKNLRNRETKGFRNSFCAEQTVRKKDVAVKNRRELYIRSTTGVLSISLHKLVDRRQSRISAK